MTGQEGNGEAGFYLRWAGFDYSFWTAIGASVSRLAASRLRTPSAQAPS